MLRITISINSKKDKLCHNGKEHIKLKEYNSTNNAKKHRTLKQFRSE